MTRKPLKFEQEGAAVNKVAYLAGGECMGCNIISPKEQDHKP